MRSVKLVFAIAICVLGLVVLAGAAQNQFGGADSHKINFVTPIRVGDTLLPKGEYQVLHTMDGQQHVMVFKQIGTKKPVEAHVKCQLTSLQAKALRTEQTYVMNAANERVLRTLVFRGDSAEHVF